MKNYYNNHSRDCFGVALANTLLELGDEETASRVIRQYRKHPLVIDTGEITFGTTTLLVRELTQSRYHGKLICNKNYWIRNYPRTLPSEIEDIVRQEISNGWIIIRKNKGCFKEPKIIMLRDNNLLCHAVTSYGNKRYYIDNGVLMPKKVYSSHEIIGIQEVRKS